MSSFPKPLDLWRERLLRPLLANRIPDKTEDQADGRERTRKVSSVLWASPSRDRAIAVRVDPDAELRPIGIEDRPIAFSLGAAASLT